VTPPESELVLLFAGLHVVGFLLGGILLVLLLRSDSPEPRRRDDDDDGGGGGGGGGPGLSPTAPAGPSDGGLPLPDAEPARVRIREGERLADLLPGRERRPAREPEPGPRRAPVG
jgi:hypothetical protein